MTNQSSTGHLLSELDRIDTLLDTYHEALGPETVVTRLTAETGATAETRPAARSIPDSPAEDPEPDTARSRLARLTNVFDLSDDHRDVLLLALAPDIDPTVHDRFGDLHDDRTLDRPTLALVADLFGTTPADKLTTTNLVGKHSPLRSHGLVTVEEPADADRSRLLSTINVTERIFDYLLDHDGLDPELAGIAQLDDTDRSLADLHIGEDLHDQIDALAADNQGRRYYFYGPDGTEKHRAIDALCASVISADLPTVLETGSLDRLRREAALLDCPLHLSEADAIFDHGDTTLESVFDALSDLETDVFVTGGESWTPTGTMATELDAILEFPYPSIALRQEFWESHTEELPEDVDPEVLAGTFRLTQGELTAALATARSLASGENLTAEDVYDGCSAQSAGELEELAQHIEPASTWEDIQLKGETERDLRVVRDHVTHQARIYSEWGFEDRFSRGTGVVALFSGPSGTGKTMAAEVLAHDVGMDLYKIDLSSVVSKYIGETEENLEEIFEAAENSNAILLFDEADAVFGDRAEVSSATDRYANVEVNYLLQRIEAYDGVVLLTSNYKSNIDDAFSRRIDHKIRFHKPDEAIRETIWREMFPEDTPVGDIDYEFLADRGYTGGSIKSICQRAAILAADDGKVEMEHLIKAIDLEGFIDPTKCGDYAQYLYGYDGPVEPRHSRQEDPDVDVSDLSPEEVIEQFFQFLRNGERNKLAELYHHKAIADEFSRKEVDIIKHGDLSITSDFERTREDSSRVVVQFNQQLNDTTETMEYELRTDEDDEQWLVFNYDRVTGRNVVVN